MPLGLSSPAQIAADSAGDLYIADRGNNRLVKMTAADPGNVAASITGLTGITGVCVDPSDNIYTAQWDGVPANAGRLRKYNSSLVQQWTFTMDSPRHLATDGTYLYVTTVTPNGLYKYRISDQALIGFFGGSGSGNGQFNDPYGVATSATEVYVVDRGNARVQVFNTSGVYQRQWAIGASARGIGIDSDNRVFVAEYGSNLVKIYSSTGEFLDSFGQGGYDGIVLIPD